MTYAERCHAYARWASRSRNRKVCKWVRLAARRHLADLKRSEKSKRYPYVFVDWHADDVCGFAEKMPHVEGQWDTPRITLEDWQCFILGCVFGWRRRSGSCPVCDEGHGVRRFNTVYEELARKNAKSTKMGIVANYCETCEGEVGPQVKTAATTGDQARIVFDIAKKMAQRTPEYREHFQVEPLANSIVCWENGGSIKPINSRASTQDGLNPHLAIIDELHAHKDRALFDVLKSARGARSNPLSWYITTAGYDSQGVCYEQRRLVCKILEGLVEADHYFGIIFTLDGHDVAEDDDSDDVVERDDEFDETVWVKANPNLGVSVSLEEFRTYALEAKESPDSHTEFLTKRLNVWTTAKHVWTNVPKWKSCNGSVDLEALRDEPCFGGLDLASVSDMTAFRLVWVVDGRLKTWGRQYVPEAAIEVRTKRFSVPYRRWGKTGDITVTPGDVTDYEFVERDIDAALSRFNVQGWAYDPWQAMDLINRLTGKGAPMVEMPQTISRLNGGMRALARYYLSGRFDHGGDPVLNWCASNVVARRDANDNIAPDRKNSEEKIDPFAALVNAMVLVASQEPTGSVYDRRGVVTV